jgi:hypothetical protein
MSRKREKAKKERVSRRNFIQHGAVGAVGAAVSQVQRTSAQGQQGSPLPAGYDRVKIFAALGDTLIPSSPDDPGYASLETYNITAEVMKGLTPISDSDLALFNSECGRMFQGKKFVELTEEQRADYLNRIVDGIDLPDTDVLGRLKSIYTLVRTRVFVIFYQNYPQHMHPRDENGAPIFPSGDEHQITNPNNPGVVTGWDIAGWKGPLTWEEEEERREHFKKVAWKE